jgi:GT2 family glycosyltransferase
MSAPDPIYSIIMVAHDALEMVQMSTLRTLRHSAQPEARLIVVDNASTDGTQTWLQLLAQRGEIELITSATNLGHGPGIELALHASSSPYVVTLDSDAFPLVDDWLERLRARLTPSVKAVGIRHHRDYIHPSCLMIERQTLQEYGLTFLNEKDRPSRFDVAERISAEIKQRGFEISGLERTNARRRGSRSEPVYLGSCYEGIIHHQWYTTRAAVAGGRRVDDVAPEAIATSLQEVLKEYHAEKRELSIVVGVRAQGHEPERLRNAQACLRALNLQDQPRWKYRIVVVEQDTAPRWQGSLGPLADRYVFAYNPGPYNRGWGFNVGVALCEKQAGALCLLDADLMVPPDFVSRGLQAYHSGMRAFLPYQEIMYANAHWTTEAICRHLVNPKESPDLSACQGERFTGSEGGCIWVDAALYNEIGGHDERFEGWGFEDRDFCLRLNRATLVSRLPGRLLHLDHPRPSRGDRWANANRRLWQQLSRRSIPSSRVAIGDPDRYRKLVPPGSPKPTEVGQREWENWHRWNEDFITGIVTREKSLPPQDSSRYRLASLVTSLGDNLLDVGCGPGAMWVHFELHRPRFCWEGADATEKMVMIARRLFPNVPVVHADSTCLPFQAKAFDIVLLRHVLEHLPAAFVQRTLEEALRVARRKVVIDFYVPPVDGAMSHIARVGQNFLETQWSRTELAAWIASGGGRIAERQSLPGGVNETNEVWILEPIEAHASLL